MNLAQVQISDSIFTFSATTDVTGHFSIPTFYKGTYQIAIGKWGFKTRYFNSYTIDSATAPLNVQLKQGYYDDFSVGLGWTETGDAITGKWVRAKPVGTDYYGFVANPDADVSNDYSDECFVTGNSGTEFGDDPVFSGSTELISPKFDISQYTNPYLDYYTWYMVVTSNNPYNSLKVYLVNDQDSILIQTIKYGNTFMSQWMHQKIRVKDFMTPSANMSIHFYAENPVGSYNLFECGLDKFQIIDSVEVGIDEQMPLTDLLQFYPNPFSDNITVDYELKENETDARLILMNTMGVSLVVLPLTQQKGIVTWGESSLPSGIYLFELRTKDGVMRTMKMVKQ
jgi:hypothetical protein